MVPWLSRSVSRVCLDRALTGLISLGLTGTTTATASTRTGLMVSKICVSTLIRSGLTGRLAERNAC